MKIGKGKSCIYFLVLTEKNSCMPCIVYVVIYSHVGVEMVLLKKSALCQRSTYYYYYVKGHLCH